MFVPDFQDEKIRFETDLTIGEDTVFYHRCLIAAGGCRYTDYAGYNYVQNPESITQKKSNYFKRLKDEPSAWIRVSEMFPYEKPKQTAVGIASWKLSSAVLHIGFSRELSNVAHLDAQLFKTGMRLALTTRNVQSILSHWGGGAAVADALDPALQGRSRDVALGPDLPGWLAAPVTTARSAI